MTMQDDDSARALYQFDWERRYALRRAWVTVIIAGLLVGLFVGLGLWRDLEFEQAPLVNLSRMVAFFIAAMFAVRAVFNLGRAMFRRTQKAHFSREGFAWQVDKEVSRYRWTQLKAYRKGARTWRLGRIPIRKFGQHRLTMNDGKTFVLHHAITSPEAFERVLDPIINAVMGEKIANTLRSDQAVKLHPKLIVTKSGVVVLKGGKKIGLKWSNVNLLHQRGKLIVQTLGKNGKFKTVQGFADHTIDNLGGFLELAETTIANHQPNRYRR